MSQFHMDAIEKSTMNGLKDFQRATVERIDYLFRNHQNRILVADEVGMGKTLIARGAIVKTAKIRQEEGDDLFKVVYICSNQNIANQNIRKLDITNGAAVGNVSDTRLSMQHLIIAEQENDQKIKEGFIQLIPLTPETSFRMTVGGGSVKERALMFAILCRIPDFSKQKGTLEKFMMKDATVSWEEEKRTFENRVAWCEESTYGKYPSNLIRKIMAYEEYDSIKDMVLRHLHERRYRMKKTYSDGYVLNKLRVMFARISVDMLEPDLVIMDEFQRFKFLLSSDESELGILSKNFLSGDKTRVLLLSATPYKLYSTLEEMEENPDEEHYKEFYQVMDFLFQGEEETFHNIWKNYSVMLNEVKAGDSTILQVKNRAENAMYKGVCRTERISVMDTGDYIDDQDVKKHLEVQDYDVLSYIQMGELMKQCRLSYSLPVDYVKSCPYLMSFMKNYKLKEHLEKYFKEHTDELEIANKNMLWINEEKINRYEPLLPTNARLERLKEKAFLNGAERYLWVPPSRPYYELQGVYKGSQEFSKILVFSSWEMVPRMIGSMISYEAERRTVGKLVRQTKNKGKKNARYFADGSKRYPAARLRFHVSKGEARGMNLFCLLYPSWTLMKLYNPVTSINKKQTLAQIEREIRQQLEIRIQKIGKKYGDPLSNRQDERWYYLAPMLMDGEGRVKNWIQVLTEEMQNDGDDTTVERGSKMFFTHVNRLKEYMYHPEEIKLGKIPDDLYQTLVDMVLGSPAVCVYRSNGHNMHRATALAKVFVNNFNQTEFTAIVELAYGRRKDTSSHWQDVLRYCKDGCFQAMFDEYQHMLWDVTGFDQKTNKNELVHNMMMDSLRIHSATYSVDTFSMFQKRMSGEKEQNQGIRIRSNYAVGFVKDTGDNTKIVNRKESIRNAFNSPMRPFVLATTSIGQEGLDFHYYCRKIMHWNLPGNPIDLEQREGRINRFKCLAIRQNVAQKYGDVVFKKDIWKEMFEAAEKNEKQDGQSDLVPYWCFGKNQSIKIERIVPMYPMSKDETKYQRLIKILSMYRLTLGQARQEELLEYIYKEFEDVTELKKLFIDLSPYSKNTMDKHQKVTEITVKV